MWIVSVCVGLCPRAMQEPEHLTPLQVDHILGCFVVGFGPDKPVEIQRVAAQSMVIALSFAQENFKEERAAQRDHIMSAICNATQFPDIKVPTRAPAVWGVLCVTVWLCVWAGAGVRL